MLIRILFLLLTGPLVANDLITDTSDKIETRIKNNDVKEIELLVGVDSVQKLGFDFDRRVQVPFENILKIIPVPQKKEIIFRGLKEGKTSVTIRDKQGNVKVEYLVKVVVNDKSKQVQELRELLGSIEGLEIGIKGGKVFVGGNIIVPTDIGRIAAVLQTYQDVLNIVELSPQTQILIAKNMQRKIQETGMRDVSVGVVNNSFWLEGVVNSQAEKDLAQTIVEGLLPNKIKPIALETTSQFVFVERSDYINFLVINEKKDPQPLPKQLKIVTQFVEIAKDYTKLFGFSWLPTLGDSGGTITIRNSDSGATTSSSGTLGGVISNLFPKLYSAKQAGYARILQTGTVTVKDGMEGKVSKSGQAPFAVGSGEGQTQATVATGFDLSVKPKVLEKENIEMGINLSIKVQTGKTDGNVPIVVDNNVNTTVITKNRESAVIGGIVLKEVSNSYDKDPRGNVESGSFLFTLNRSKSYQQNKSQYVVFMTASIMDSASEGVNEIKRKFRYKGR